MRTFLCSKLSQERREGESPRYLSGAGGWFSIWTCGLAVPPARRAWLESKKRNSGKRRTTSEQHQHILQTTSINVVLNSYFYTWLVRRFCSGSPPARGHCALCCVFLVGKRVLCQSAHCKRRPLPVLASLAGSRPNLNPRQPQAKKQQHNCQENTYSQAAQPGPKQQT